MGNNLIHDLTYNSRLQPTLIRLGTTAAPTSVLNLTYNYGTTDNNGNVLDVTEKLGAWTSKQVFTYDALNRLDSISETNGSTTTWWTEDNAYDRWGNRWEVIAGTTPPSFSSKNQLNGYSYDLAGNVIDDTAHTYDYDAENRLTVVDSVANSFVYDGEGKRVKKYFPLDEQVRFVYGVGGQLLMEFNPTNGTLKKEYVYEAGALLAIIEPGTGTSYVTADHLGSPRVLTNSSGGVVSRHDYKPFGRELKVGDGGRTAAQFFDVSDSLRQKFASYEQDTETSWSYAQTRYYANTLGRFTSPDDFLNDTRPADPQSWNLYAYVGNNPLRFNDPKGTIKKDANGNVIFDVAQQNVTRRYVNEQLTDGTRLVVRGQVDAGHIYADDGTAIKADRSLGPLTATRYDANGNIVSQNSVDQITLNGESWAGFNNTADCHGVTFAAGQVWINNDQVPALLKGDGYDVNNPVSTPKVGDVGIYSTNGSLSPSTVRHSVTVTKVDPNSGAVSEVMSKGGITVQVIRPPGPGPNTAWSDTSAKLQYYRKDPVLNQNRKLQGLAKESRVY